MFTECCTKFLNSSVRHMELNDKRISVVGLGYVGLPLAVEFGKKYEGLGFDTNLVRIDELGRKLTVQESHRLKRLIHQNFWNSLQIEMN